MTTVDSAARAKTLAGSIDRRNALSAERKRVVAAASGVRRQTTISIGLMTLVVVVGGVFLALLIRAEQTVNHLSTASNHYSDVVDTISARIEILLDDEYRRSAPADLVRGVEREISELFKVEDQVSGQIAENLVEARRSTTRFFSFVSPNALTEFENSVIDPATLAVARQVPVRLMSAPDRTLTPAELGLKAAVLNDSFAGPAHHAETLVHEMVEEAGAEFRRYAVVVGLATLGALGLVWMMALRPALGESRLVVDALDRHGAEIEHSYARVSAAQQIARLGYWYKNMSNNTFECSPELAEMLTGDAARRPTNLHELATMTSGGTDDDVEAIYRRLGVEPGEAELTHTISRPNGHDITIRERVQSFSTGNSIAISGVMLDISEITTAQQVMHRMEKFEIVDLLISGIAHDFNNLLGIIMGNAELALGSAEPATAQNLDSIIDASETAAQLIVQLRQTAIDPLAVAEEFNVADAVRQATKAIQVPRNVNFDIRIDDAAQNATVVANQGLFENSVLNLVRNAFEATRRRDGEVRVSVVIDDDARTVCSNEPDVDDEMASSKPWHNGRRSIRIVVTDNGVGMTDRVRRRALQPFFSTKQRQHGTHTGLGLWSAFSFAKSWDGTIEIDSSPEDGSVVGIVLPVAATEGTTESSATPSGCALEPLSLAGRVLLVDDLTELLAVNERLLASWGLDVVAVDGFDEAVQVLNDNDDIALLVSDVRLGPGPTGFDLATIFLERHPDLGALLISGAFRAEDMPEALLTSQCFFLPKPFSHARLHDTLEALLQRTQQSASI